MQLWARLRDLFAVDLRSLALLRIGLGVSVFADTTIRALDLVGLYTDRGVLPRELLLAMDGRGVFLSAHYWASAHPVWQGALFALTAGAAIALLVGWRTRLATLLCVYLVASVQVRQPLTYVGGDSILRLLLFWGLFLPLSARFSVDALQGRVRRGPDSFISGGTVALLLQVCLIYWATGIRKTGELWWNGQAIFYALHLEEWVTPFGVWLREHRSVLEPITYGVLGLELLGPFLAFVPVYTGAFRLLTVAMFWAFHLGLATAMNIGLFPLFSMVAWLPFVPAQAWAWCGVGATTGAPEVRSWRSRTASVIAIVLIAYVAVLVGERTRILPRVLPDEAQAVGTALRLQQGWSMFAPDPSNVTTPYEVRRRLSDGTAVYEPASTSFRWTVYLWRAGAERSPESPLALSVRLFARYLCAESSRATGPRTEHLEILAHRIRIRAGGAQDPVTRTVVDVPCQDQAQPAAGIPTGHPKSDAISSSGSHSPSVSSGTPGMHNPPNGPAGTLNDLARTSGAVNCSTSARLFAAASRTVSGSSPQRHSIIFRTDV
jgi:hypothetical protein